MRSLTITRPKKRAIPDWEASSAPPAAGESTLRGRPRPDSNYHRGRRYIARSASLSTREASVQTAVSKESESWENWRVTARHSGGAHIDRQTRAPSLRRPHFEGPVCSLLFIHLRHHDHVSFFLRHVPSIDLSPLRLWPTIMLCHGASRCRPRRLCPLTGRRISHSSSATYSAPSA